MVAVEAINTAAGPAGLLAKLTVRMCGRATRRTGHERDLDVHAIRKPPEWDQPGFDDRGWRVPEICGRYGAPPWGSTDATRRGRRAAADPLTERGSCCDSSLTTSRKWRGMAAAPGRGQCAERIAAH